MDQRRRQARILAGQRREVPLVHHERRRVLLDDRGPGHLLKTGIRKNAEHLPGDALCELARGVALPHVQREPAAEDDLHFGDRRGGVAHHRAGLSGAQLAVGDEPLELLARHRFEERKRGETIDDGLG
jgi:hypothetical protein